MPVTVPVALHSIASAALERHRNHSHSINEKMESHRNSVVCVITIHWEVRDVVPPKTHRHLIPSAQDSGVKCVLVQVMSGLRLLA